MRLLFEIGDSVRHTRSYKKGTIHSFFSANEVFIQWENQPMKKRNRPVKCSNLVLIESLEQKYPWWVTRVHKDPSDQAYVSSKSFIKTYSETFEDQLEARYLLESRDLWFHQLKSPTSKWTTEKSDKFQTQQGRYVEVLEFAIIPVFCFYITQNFCDANLESCIVGLKL